VDGYVLGDRTTEDTEDRTGWEQKNLVDVQAALMNIDKNFFEKLNNSEKNNKRRLIRYLEILKTSDRLHDAKPKIKKPPYDFKVIGLEIGMETLRKRIKQRILDRLQDDAMIKEVERLHKNGLSWRRLESFGLEYKFVAYYLQKKLSKSEMVEKLSLASGQFAKRQMTWFRRWEKQGREIQWIKASTSPRSVISLWQKL
jgi:tRNA dimethylallyltransferase